METNALIANSLGNGDMADRLMASNFDPRVCRPYSGPDGRAYITQNDANEKSKVVCVGNTTTTLRQDDWKQIDDAVVKAGVPRLKLVADLRGRGLQYTIPNGMGKTVLETDTQSDINDADISMDGIRKSQADLPVFERTSMPLPIIHKDFSISARRIQASRNGGSPLDTTAAESAARKVAEMAEQVAIGSLPSSAYAYAGGTIYGLTNYTGALTKTITTPDGTNGATTVIEIAAMMQQSRAAYHYGPWMVYNAPNWAQFLDLDYSAAKGDNTLRQRIMTMDGIMGIQTLDYMTNYDLILVQMTTDVIRMVIGMEIITLQWDTIGGLQKNFKVMAIMVPQIRADQNDNTGIVYGSV